MPLDAHDDSGFGAIAESFRDAGTLWCIAHFRSS
jgi:hypothetical protein